MNVKKKKKRDNYNIYAANPTTWTIFTLDFHALCGWGSVNLETSPLAFNGRFKGIDLENIIRNLFYRKVIKKKNLMVFSMKIVLKLSLIGL